MGVSLTRSTELRGGQKFLPKITFLGVEIVFLVVGFTVGQLLQHEHCHHRFHDLFQQQPRNQRQQQRQWWLNNHRRQ